MLASLARGAIVLIALGAPASAGDLADFNAATESVAAHNRVAIGYLRTGNADLAELELDRLRKAWGELQQRFAGIRGSRTVRPAFATIIGAPSPH